MERKIIEGKLVNIKAIAITIFVIIAGFVNAVGFSLCYRRNVIDCADWSWSWDWVVERYGENASVFTVSMHDYRGQFFAITVLALIVAGLFYLMFSKKMCIRDRFNIVLCSGAACTQAYGQNKRNQLLHCNTHLSKIVCNKEADLIPPKITRKRSPHIPNPLARTQRRR